MLLAENDDVVQTLAPDRSDGSLREGVLPRAGAVRTPQFRRGATRPPRPRAGPPRGRQRVHRQLGRRRTVDHRCPEKESVIVLLEALDALGDRRAAMAFSGEGADHVRVLVAKDFAERVGALVWRRVAALRPTATRGRGPRSVTPARC